MTSKIRSVSITKEQDDWLNTHNYINVSKITQKAIDEAIILDMQSTAHAENKALRERLESVTRELGRRATFISQKGLYDEYEAWQEKNR